MQGIVPSPDEPSLEQALEKILPTQKEFISCPDRFAGYVGGWRSGKTVSGAVNMTLFGWQHPGTYLIGRWNEPALRDTTMKTFLSICPLEWTASYLKEESKVTLKNGTQFLFRHLDVPDLHKHLRSLNLRGFWWDEATEGNEKVFMMLQGRLSTGDPRIGRVTSNPNGHDWVWRRFYDPHRKKELLKYRGYLAKTGENINLPSDYIQDMRDSLPQDWQDRYLDASFSEFEDSIWKEFSEETHVWDASKCHAIFGGRSSPPESWPVYVGLDIGGVDPWVFTFIAVSPQGNLYQFDEIYQSGVLVKDLSDLFYEKLGNRELVGLAYDYENQQAALELQEYGIAGIPAIKSVKPGILKVAQYMHIDPTRVHPFNGKQGAPSLYFSSNCENTVSSIPEYKWEKNQKGDTTGKPADVNADCPDSLRYNIHTFRPTPGEGIELKPWQNPDLDEMSRMYWYNAEKERVRKENPRRRRFQYRYIG